jgi:hypothetical protein
MRQMTREPSIREEIGKKQTEHYETSDLDR